MRQYRNCRVTFFKFSEILNTVLLLKSHFITKHLLIHISAYAVYIQQYNILIWFILFCIRSVYLCLILHIYCFLYLLILRTKRFYIALRVYICTYTSLERFGGRKEKKSYKVCL